MKSISTVAALLFSTVLLYSCHRDYTCECRRLHSTIVDYNKLGRIPGPDADNICPKMQHNYHYYDTCILTSVK